MKNLAGQAAIVTGATGGLGPHIVLALAKQGMNLVLCASTSKNLDNLLALSAAGGARAVSVVGDLANQTTIESVVATGEREFGSIHVLVNNAGIESFSAYHKLPPDMIERTVRVNLTAAMLLARRVLPKMLEQRCGHVVNISSLSAKAGPPFAAAYAASKAGLIAFTESLRMECKGTGVSASVVCPGFVKAGMYERLLQETGFRAPPLLGVAEPEDVAKAVVRAIKKDVPEIIVNPRPTRVLTTLAEASPSLGEILVRVTGGAGWFRKMAQFKETRSSE